MTQTALPDRRVAHEQEARRHKGPFSVVLSISRHQVRAVSPRVKTERAACDGIVVSTAAGSNLHVEDARRVVALADAIEALAPN